MKRHFYILLILLFGTIMSALPQRMTISGGAEYGVVICNKGFVYAWGKNTNGVLGIDPAESGNTPNAVNITRPQKVKLPPGITMQQVVAGSGSFTVVLSCNGVVYCWGTNGSGECGQGMTSQVVTEPMPVMLAGSGIPGYEIEGTLEGDFLGGVKYVAAFTNSGYGMVGEGSAEFDWDGKYLGKGMPTTDCWYEINIKEINKQM